MTSPGRQAANGERADRAARGRAARSARRLLSAQEEGRLAFLGARLGTRAARRGGSSRSATSAAAPRRSRSGTRRDGLAWVRSIDIGSMRLTSRLLDDDPPGDAAVARARVEVDRLLEGLLPPAPETALAVGGSARALRSIVGAVLGADELDEVAGILARTPAQRDRRPLRHRARARPDARRRRGHPRRAPGAAPRAAPRRPRRRARGRGARARRSGLRSRLEARARPRRSTRRIASGRLARASRRSCRSCSTIRPAASRDSSVASSRTRCSATTASWWAPITSWTVGEGVGELLERPAGGGRGELGRVPRVLGA